MVTLIAGRNLERVVTRRLDAACQRIDLASDDARDALASRLLALERRLELCELRASAREPKRLLAQSLDRLTRLQSQLRQIVEEKVKQATRKTESLAKLLHALSPDAVLARGFALATSQSGTIIRSSAMISSGATLTLKFARGGATVEVREVKDAGNPSNQNE